MKPNSPTSQLVSWVTEYYVQHQSPVSVTDIAKGLGWPESKVLRCAKDPQVRERLDGFGLGFTEGVGTRHHYFPKPEHLVREVMDTRLLMVKMLIAHGELVPTNLSRKELACLKSLKPLYDQPVNQE